MNLLIVTLLFGFSLGCSNLVLTYDPNEILGIDLQCLQDPKTDDGFIIIEPSNSCSLLCDGVWCSTFECENGQWTGSPENGFYIDHRSTQLAVELWDKDILCEDKHKDQYRVNNAPENRGHIWITYEKCEIIKKTNTFLFSVSIVSFYDVVLQGLAALGFVSTVYYVIRSVKPQKIAIHNEAEI